jgi:NRAMP (natural resistance-associated macrophage protein)-like metal ion transporter
VATATPSTEASTADAGQTSDGGASPSEARRSPVGRFFGLLGPGLIAGASDDDPSGVATYAQAGATFGNSLLWTVPLTLPLMIATQEICDRTALATGQSLGALARRKFTGSARGVIAVLLVALVGANCLNIAADLMAIGQGMELVHAGPAPVWAALAGIGITLVLAFGTFEIIGSVFKWLCMALLAYVVVLFAVHLNWAEVLRGMTAQHLQLKPAYFALLVAVLGTSISPYLFFWQSAHRIEELRAEELGGDAAPALRHRSKRAAERKLRHSRIDVFAGMAFSVLIMFAIIAATAATLGVHGTTINSAADAAKALEPVAGNASGLLFAVGFIGSGILAVPVLAASGSAGMAGLLNKKWGLDHSPRKAPFFYGLLIVGLVTGTILSIVDADAIRLLILSAIVNGIAAGPFLIVVMLISRDRKLMGEHANGKLAATLGWLTTAIMLVAGVAGIWLTVTGS